MRRTRATSHAMTGQSFVISLALALAACSGAGKTKQSVKDAGPADTQAPPTSDARTETTPVPRDAVNTGPDAAADAASLADGEALRDSALSAQDGGRDAAVARDAGVDRTVRGDALGDADGGGGSVCTGTLLLGQTLPLATGWGMPAALGDLDGDGKLDLVTSINVLFGTGDGQFPDKLDAVRGDVVGDLNGDGALDLVATNSGRGTVSVFLGKGDRSFTSAKDYPAGGEDDPTKVVLGDLNDDGKLDIVTANFASSTVSVLLGKGNGTFAPKTDYPTGVGPTTPALGDLNGDGKLDLVVVDYSDAAISVFLGLGDGTLASKQDLVIPIVPRWAYGSYEETPTALADLNGDRKVDLVLLDDQPGNAYVLLGKGDGTFASPASYPVGERASSLVLADMNGDAKLDLVTSSGGAMAVLLGQGDGTFAAKLAAPSFSSYSRALVVGDLNGDGRLDVAAHGGVLLFGKGDGTFDTWGTVTTGAGPVAIALRDLDGDGKLDLVTANAAASTVSVLLGKGDGTFAAKADFPTGADPRVLVLADMNGDGKPDVVTGNADATTVGVLLGKGDGTFAAPKEAPTGAPPMDIAVGDLNGDGKPDLVTVGSGPVMTINDGIVSVLLGKGDGTFAPKVDLGAGMSTSGIAIGDMNGDGKSDLVVANAGADDWWSLDVMLGKGDGTFTKGSSDSTVYGSASVELADLNGDGILDVITGHTLTGTSVSVLFGRGDGTLSTKVDYATAGSAIALGDMNGDGRPDLVTDGPSVLFAQADGSFTGRADYMPVGTAVALGDVNADGRLDVAQIGRSNTVNMLLGACR
jgi:hypothetical protein